MELLDNLKEYFENTPVDELEADWEEIKHWNEIGPDVLEYKRIWEEYRAKGDRTPQMPCDEE